MGRQFVPPQESRGRPTGPKWTAFRRRLWLRAAQASAGIVTCYHCKHQVAGLAVAEVQHLISPSVNPALAWSPDNLRWSHGGGRKRCPACQIACNAVAAANEAPRDADGRPLPWPADFIKRKSAEAKAKLAAQPGVKPRANPSASSSSTAKAAPGPASVPAATGPPAGIPSWARDIRSDGTFECDQPLMHRGRVVDARPGAGCTERHRPGEQGRCW